MRRWKEEKCLSSCYKASVETWWSEEKKKTVLIEAIRSGEGFYKGSPAVPQTGGPRCELVTIFQIWGAWMKW